MSLESKVADRIPFLEKDEGSRKENQKWKWIPIG